MVFLFHATALVYFTLPVIDDQKDLMNKAGELFERDYNAFLHFPVAALYFLADLARASSSSSDSSTAG